MLRGLPIFRFSQLEVPWLLGPPDGRYLVRDSEREPTQVLLFATLSAERKRSRRSARQRAAATEPGPTAVSTQRVTIISAAPFTDAATAQSWLSDAGESDLSGDLTVLEAVLHTFGVVTTDARVRAPARDDLLVARIGYGEGEEVAYGKWSEARELLAGAPRRKRSKVLEPQARLAAALGQRTPPLLCEDLTMRARADLDAGRRRAAALALTIALDAALTELTPSMAADMKSRSDELASELEPVTAAAAAALRRELTPPELETVSFTLGRIEAALRARAAASA